MRKTKVTMQEFGNDECMQQLDHNCLLLINHDNFNSFDLETKTKLSIARLTFGFEKKRID